MAERQPADLRPRERRGDPNVAVLLTWFLPGAGHLYLGRYASGLVLLLLVEGLYALGWLLSDGRVFEFLDPELQGPLATAMGAELEAHPDSAGLVVVADRTKIQQVLVNLVTNSLDALRGQRRGRIVLGATPDDQRMIRVEVRDTGAGIAPEVRESLFDPFVTTKEAGTGLGLAIAKRIVERHGGRMGVEPASPHGTIAWLTLPAGSLAGP